MMRAVLVVVWAWCWGVAQAAVIDTDFSWIPPGSSTSASTVLADGTVVTLRSDPIPFDDFQSGVARVFRFRDSNWAQVSLSFDRPVWDLQLEIDDLDQRGPEWLQDFNVVPTAVSGFLSLDPLAGVVSPLADDEGGVLFWSGLALTEIRFTYARCDQCGLYLRRLSFTSVPVSAPPPWALLGVAALAWGWRRRR